ncbi:hypothetical protein PQ692_09170 [Thermoanaerobacterium thermosaccharolyticum]
MIKKYKGQYLLRRSNKCCKRKQSNPGMMSIYDDSFIDEYKKLANLVHNYGLKIIMQIAYSGTKITFNFGERVIYASSEVAERDTNVVGKEL